MKSEWRELPLDEAVIINPATKLLKGSNYPFVEMKALTPNYKLVRTEQNKIFNGGGSRFKDGDVLMARISPCLENGKISRYQAIEKDSVAHGSTEFIVIRHRDKITYPEYIYYLAQSDTVKQFAIKQMSGTTGRQRVPTDSLKHLKIKLPPIKIQKNISDILKVLDSKIEINHRICETLEKIASAIFKSLFVDCKLGEKETGKNSLKNKFISYKNIYKCHLIKNFPEKELISVYEMGQFLNGAAFKNQDFCRKPYGLPIIKISELKSGIGNDTKHTNKTLEKKYLVQNNDILFSWSGSPETSIDVFLWTNGTGWLNQHIFKVTPSGKYTREYLYLLLKYLKPQFIKISKNKQTTGLGHITINDLKKIKFPMLRKEKFEVFNEKINPIFKKFEKTLKQTAILTKIRDNLIPKLLSGEVKIE